jgi:hypothetical protein
MALSLPAIAAALQIRHRRTPKRISLYYFLGSCATSSMMAPLINICLQMTQIGLVQGQDRFRTAIAGEFYEWCMPSLLSPPWHPSDAIKTYQNAPTEVWVKADSKDLYSWNEIQQLGGRRTCNTNWKRST